MARFAYIYRQGKRRKLRWAVLVEFTLLVLFQTVWADPAFHEDFTSYQTRLWHLSAGAEGKVSFRDNRLMLDLSKPQRGKWATAELHIAISLPARLEWDQCLAHDSRYTWFCGVLLWSSRRGTRENVSAGLGGGGLKNCVFLSSERSSGEIVKEGKWYHLIFEIRKDHQILTVFPRGGKEPSVRIECRYALVNPPFFLRFFQNDLRLGPRLPDTYNQDRGVTWIDNLVVSAASLEERKPPEQVITYPYKVPVVFSRAMRWMNSSDGLKRGCIAYDAVERLALTGRASASRWLYLKRWRELNPLQWPKQPNVEIIDEENTIFTLPDNKDEAAFVLRAFQFNTEQHPRLEWDAQSQGVRWQIEITATDGVHTFFWKLWRSKWFTGRERGTVNIASLYHRSGRPNRYVEVDLLLRLHRIGAKENNGKSQLRLRLSMPSRVAIVPRWPLVTTVREARESGVPIEAVIVNGAGQVVDNSTMALEAEVAGQKVILNLVGEEGARRGFAHGLAAGNYDVRLIARDVSGRAIATTVLTISVTPLDFVNHYEREKRSFCTEDGTALGPLLGDLFAWMPYADLGTERQELILGLKEYNYLIKEEGRQFAYTKWRSMPRADIDAYIDYMAESGIRVIRLTPNVNPCEYYLDAGGHLAPHGLEQLSYILAAARRHGIRVVINLFHYPYLHASTGNNPPVWQYIEAGYPSQMKWTSPKMWGYLSRYLDELLGFTGSDPAVIAYTVTGENDQLYSSEWINRSFDFIKSHAPRQMVVLEQGGSIYHCRGADPSSYSDYKPASDGGIGYRAYGTYRYPNDCFIAVAARFYDLSLPSFLGEVACGINTQLGFINKYRDAMGIALTLQKPMAIAWAAVMIEGQCKAFSEVARIVDWTSFRRARPPVAIILDKPDKRQVSCLVDYEEALSAIPVDYEYLRPNDSQKGYAVVFDAREEFRQPILGKTLPEAIATQIPIILSPGNHCSYAFSADRRWLVAYIRNAQHYEIGICDVRSVERYRLTDQKRDISIVLHNFQGQSYCRILNAATAELVFEDSFFRETQVRLPNISADLLVLVTPAR